jgi:hypothetical protein
MGDCLPPQQPFVHSDRQVGILPSRRLSTPCGLAGFMTQPVAAVLVSGRTDKCGRHGGREVDPSAAPRRPVVQNAFSARVVGSSGRFIRSGEVGDGLCGRAGPAWFIPFPVLPVWMNALNGIRALKLEVPSVACSRPTDFDFHTAAADSDTADKSPRALSEGLASEGARSRQKMALCGVEGARLTAYNSAAAWMVPSPIPRALMRQKRHRGARGLRKFSVPVGVGRTGLGRLHPSNALARTRTKSLGPCLRALSEVGKGHRYVPQHLARSMHESGSDSPSAAASKRQVSNSGDVYSSRFVLELHHALCGRPIQQSIPGSNWNVSGLTAKLELFTEFWRE